MVSRTIVLVTRAQNINIIHIPPAPRPPFTKKFLNPYLFWMFRNIYRGHSYTTSRYFDHYQPPPPLFHTDVCLIYTSSLWLLPRPSPRPPYQHDVIYERLLMFLYSNMKMSTYYFISGSSDLDLLTFIVRIMFALI